MTVIGVTGGTGSGKTTLLRFLQERGAAVLACDRVYDELLARDEKLQSDLRREFPTAFSADGMLDRAALAEAVFSEILPERRVLRRHVRGAGSTDMGDLSAIMPTIQPYAPGAVGTSHGNDYYLVDPEVACVDNAKWQLAILFSLLEKEAEEARRILAAFKPRFESAEAFLAYMDALYDAGERITYTEEGATARL